MVSKHCKSLGFVFLLIPPDIPGAEVYPEHVLMSGSGCRWEVLK